jgi:hypothetical protein
MRLDFPSDGERLQLLEAIGKVECIRIKQGKLFLNSHGEIACGIEALAR